MKKLYVFFCMNEFIDGKKFYFDNDRKAIEFAKDYEAICVRVTGENEGKIIYDPTNWL